MLQQKYLQYWCYFSSVSYLTFMKSEFGLSVPQHLRRGSVDMCWCYTSTSISSPCSCKQIFFTQRPTSCTWPPSPLGWHERRKRFESYVRRLRPRWGRARSGLARAWSLPHAPTHRRRPRRDGRGESEPCEVQKRGNERRSEGMARTAWHLNRGFPPCTLSSLRCLHKGRLFTHSSYQSARVLCILSVKEQPPRLLL